MGDSPLTRRNLLWQAGAAGLAASQLDVAEAAAAARPPRRPRTPTEALNALMAGNRRFVRGSIKAVDYNRLGERIAQTQKPLAAIITCADSRISPSVIFDVGLGNVFVSRVAGNSVDPGTIGGTEYAVAVLGVHLVMVLGHSNCGAVKAAIEVVSGKTSFPARQFGSIGQVIDALTGPVRSVPKTRRTVARCIDVNAQAQARRVASRRPIIKPAVDAGRLRVVAAVYDIGTGRVSLV
jgi:carbonic anhydrase